MRFDLRFAHYCVQVLRHDQLAKMREHGVIASIQPQFVPSDAAWLSSKLPQQLLSLAFPWKSLLEAGNLFYVVLDSLFHYSVCTCGYSFYLDGESL